MSGTGRAALSDPSPGKADGKTTALMIIVGGDALALSAAREICQIPGHRVVVLWPGDAEFAAEVEAVGARFLPGRPDSRDGLIAAGVDEAIAILALSPDDQLNLQSALRARDANPQIRIVLRQFNRAFAAKIEQNLANCSVLSLAWHSAATYAASVLDPSCLRGLQFPEPDGPLTGFAARTADVDLAGLRVAQAEETLGARIVAIDGSTELLLDRPIEAGARLIVYGTLDRLLDTAPQQPHVRHRRRISGLPRRTLQAGMRRLRRIDGYLGGFAAAAFVMFLIGTWHFHDSLQRGWLTAAYFVLTTMTTTGFGDISPRQDKPWDVAFAMTLMLTGTALAGIFVAYAASLLTRAQWVRMQGLRPIHRHDHIVVCGCGSVGTAVVDLLLAFDKPVVVIDTQPDTALIERARDRGFDLLTGDASRDDTLDLCNLGEAHGLVALTNADTLNLEIALGARVRNPHMPIVLRIAEAGFAASIAQHFQFETTFSVAALAGPAFAGLSRLPGARGRIACGEQEFAIVEVVMPPEGGSAVPRLAIPLAAAAQEGDFRLIRDAAALDPGDRALFLVPLAPFREGRESLSEIIDRVAGR